MTPTDRARGRGICSEVFQLCIVEMTRRSTCWPGRNPNSFVQSEVRAFRFETNKISTCSNVKGSSVVCGERPVGSVPSNRRKPWQIQE